jgi:hypothetical protein
MLDCFLILLLSDFGIERLGGGVQMSMSDTNET